MLSGVVDSDVHLFVADVIKGFLVGFAMLTLSTIRMFGFGLSLQLSLVSLGLGMVEFLRGVL